MPTKVSEHFHGLRAAQPALRAFAVFDRLDRDLPDGFTVRCHLWGRREIENYVASRDILLRFAAGSDSDDLVSRAEAETRTAAMKAALDDIETGFRLLRRDPWSVNEKVASEVLEPLFAGYYERLGISNHMQKSNYHRLVEHMTVADIPAEMIEALDGLAAAAGA